MRKLRLRMENRWACGPVMSRDPGSQLPSLGAAGPCSGERLTKVSVPVLPLKVPVIPNLTTQSQASPQEMGGGPSFLSALGLRVPPRTRASRSLLYSRSPGSPVVQFGGPFCSPVIPQSKGLQARQTLRPWLWPSILPPLDGMEALVSWWQVGRGLRGMEVESDSSG